MPILQVEWAFFNNLDYEERLPYLRAAKDAIRHKCVLRCGPFEGRVHEMYTRMRTKVRNGLMSDTQAIVELYLEIAGWERSFEKLAWWAQLFLKKRSKILQRLFFRLQVCNTGCGVEILRETCNDAAYGLWDLKSAYMYGQWKIVLRRWYVEDEDIDKSSWDYARMKKGESGICKHRISSNRAPSQMSIEKIEPHPPLEPPIYDIETNVNQCKWGYFVLGAIFS